MQSPRSGRYLVAGSLAGASGALALMACYVLLLLVGLTWQYAFNSQIPIIRDTAIGAVLQDIGRLPSSLWAWRWILLGMVVLGLLLSSIDRFAQRYLPPWRDRMAAAALFVAVCTIVISGLLTGAEQSLPDGGALSEGLPTLQARQGAAFDQIFIGASIALGGAAALWLYWSWWYTRWRRWMRLDQPNGDAAGTDSSADAWFAMRQLQDRAQRMLIVALVAGVVLMIAAIAGYEQVRADVRSGELWVDPSAPKTLAQLTFSRPTRTVLIENIYGSGTVAFTLLSARDLTPVAAPAELTFRDLRAGAERAALPVTELPPGDYLLSAELRSGEGGRLGYALIEQYELLAVLVAVAVGLSTGATLACAVLVISIYAQPRLT